MQKTPNIKEPGMYALKQTANQELVRNLDLEYEQIKSFRTNGFIKLNNLLTPYAISRLHQITNDQVRQLPGRKEFSRLTYDIGTNDTLVEEIYRSEAFKRITSSLIETPLMFTQGVGFGLGQGDKGFPWHTGVVSFSYIHPDDNAYTLWIPLNEINVKAQHGGMAYTSRQQLSGEYRFKLWSQAIADPEIRDQFHAGQTQYIYHPSEAEEAILEKAGIEDNFSLGDALLFDKFVWHRSAALAPGPLDLRTAYVLRFVDGNARYSRSNLDNTVAAFQALGRPMCTNFGYRFSDLRDNDKLCLSRYANPLI